jgi:hypothetical protein
MRFRYPDGILVFFRPKRSVNVMKLHVPVVLFACVVILLCPPLQAQWVQGFGAQVSQTNAIVALGSTLFAGTGSGVYSSTDGGLRWTNATLTSSYVNSLIVKGEILIVAVWEGKNSVYLSTDHGSTWVGINNGLPSNVYVQRLATDGEQIFAGTSAHGLFVTSDNGATWRQVSTTLTVSSVIAFGFNYATMFIATGGNDGVLRSTDHGLTWSAVNNGLPEFGISSFVIHDSSLLALSFYHGMIYKSSNNGETWTALNALPQVDEMVSSGKKLLAAAWGNGVVLSENGGLSFSPMNDGLSTLYVSTIALIGNYLFAGTESKGIWRRPLSEFVTSVPGTHDHVGSDFVLEQNYPNPFNSSSEIRYQISDIRYVRLVVYDLLGREVATLVDEAKPAGLYTVRFDGSALPSGVYLYRLRAGSFVETKRLTLLR